MLTFSMQAVFLELNKLINPYDPNLKAYRKAYSQKIPKHYAISQKKFWIPQNNLSYFSLQTSYKSLWRNGEFLEYMSIVKSNIPGYCYWCPSAAFDHNFAGFPIENFLVSEYILRMLKNVKI